MLPYCSAMNLFQKSILLFAFAMVCLLGKAYGQNALTKANEQRLQVNKVNMLVLGSWATGNLVFSGIRRSQTLGQERYFHEMNVYWNIVNLGLAASGYIGAMTADPDSFTLAQTFYEQQKLEKILLFNCALNFTYITAGALLREKSKTALNKPERLKGYGNSLMLQGAFLLLFDSAQIIAHQQAGGKTLKTIMPHVQYIGNGLSVHWTF